jgi:lipopolysaccharide transport system ATP-binding protein
MGEVAKGGRTVLFVSHNMAAVQLLCKSGIHIKEGEIIYNGITQKCIDNYMQYKKQGTSILSRIDKCHDNININSINVNGKDQNILAIGPNNDTLNIEIMGELYNRMKMDMEVRITDTSDIPLAFYSPGHENADCEYFPEGKFQIIRKIKMPKRMNKGIYNINIALTNPGILYLVNIPSAFQIEVVGTPTCTGWVFEYNKGAGWLLLSSE